MKKKASDTKKTAGALTLKDKKILLVGCGKMGSAILEGWLSTKAVRSSRIVVIEPDSGHLTSYSVRIIKDIKELEDKFNPEIVIFAIKPQIMASILPQYKKFSKALFISIAAGKTISFLEKHLSKEAAIIRAMPNLPAAVGLGVTVLVSNKAVKKRHLDMVTMIFEPCSQVIIIEDEKLMDQVTAVSGSGPAYLFYFMECLIEAAKKAGLPGQLAEELVLATISGSANLAVRIIYESSENISDVLIGLRKSVASPGGTTEAALKVLLDKPAMKELVNKAVNSATKRSRELRE